VNEVVPANAASAAPAWQLDAGGDVGMGLAEVAAHAALAEELGADGVVLSELKHDPFVALALAAQATKRISLFTGIVVAFSRNPMTVAVAANDIHELSGGRLILGLGSQVRQHIEYRYSMPWSQPAARMADFILAVRDIWAAWRTGERLNHRGEFYKHTLMTPFFSPEPNPYGEPPIWLAAVGERMTETAGAVADGMMVHAFHTERYLREVTLPALDRGAAAAGRARPGLSVPAFVVLGRDRTEQQAAAIAVARQIAFYGSTPTYLPVLDLHGWAGLHEQLNGLSRRGDWAGMGALITEDVLHTLAAVGTPEEVAAELRARYGDLATRLTFTAPYPLAAETWRDLYRALRA